MLQSGFNTLNGFRVDPHSTDINTIFREKGCQHILHDADCTIAYRTLQTHTHTDSHAPKADM